MTQRPANVPAGAIWHDLVPFLKPHDVPSQFLRGTWQRIFKFHCPACDTEQPDPAPVVPRACINCGLRMTKGPNLSLWTWPAKAPELQEAG